MATSPISSAYQSFTDVLEQQLMFAAQKAVRDLLADTPNIQADVEVSIVGLRVGEAPVRKLAAVAKRASRKRPATKSAPARRRAPRRSVGTVTLTSTSAEARSKIVSLMREGVSTVEGLREQMDPKLLPNENALHSHLSKMVSSGVLVRTGKGTYAIPEESPTP